MNIPNPMSVMPTDKSIDNWAAQLRKGTLELSVLAALAGQRLYGLALLKLLQEQRSTAISEGTLYPLLDRMKRDQLLDAQWEQCGDSRPRKYYQLTAQGNAWLLQLEQHWRQTVLDLDILLARPAVGAIKQGAC